MAGFDPRVKSPQVDRLFEAILSLETMEDCYRFFSDLSTIGEIQAMAQRFQVAELLNEGKTYEEIVNETGISTATISRIKRYLNWGADGYKLAIERLQQEEG